MQNVHDQLYALSNGRQLTLTAGETPRCFILPFIPAGLLKKLIVVQAGGAATAFTVDLFNAHVCATDEPGYQSSEQPSDLSKVLAKVIPTQTQNTPGAAMELFSEDGYAFRNTMGSHSDPRRELYIEINPTTSSEDTVWEVAMAAIPAVVS